MAKTQGDHRSAAAAKSVPSSSRDRAMEIAREWLAKGVPGVTYRFEVSSTTTPGLLSVYYEQSPLQALGRHGWLTINIESGEITKIEPGE